jgi:ankyrin repeat protein
MIPFLVGNLEPLRAVIQIGYLDVLQQLVNEQNFDVNRVDKADGRTPIFEAARTGRTDIAAFLISKRAQINVLDDSGLSPLAVGLAAGSFAAATFLMQKGAVVMQRLQNDSTPLHVAAGVNGGHAVLHALLQRGAALDAQDVIGRTPLHLSATAEIAEVFLREGANATRTKADGLLPLHSLARSGHARALETVLSWRQSGVDEKTWRGDSALHLAAMNQQVRTAGVLLRFCANYRSKNAGGYRASAFAFEPHLVKLLMRADTSESRCQCDCPPYQPGLWFTSSKWHGGNCSGTVGCRLGFGGQQAVQCDSLSSFGANSSVANRTYMGRWVPAHPTLSCPIGVSSTGQLSPNACMLFIVCALTAWSVCIPQPCR